MIFSWIPKSLHESVLYIKSSFLIGGSVLNYTGDGGLCRYKVKLNHVRSNNQLLGLERAHDCRIQLRSSLGLKIAFYKALGIMEIIITLDILGLNFL